MRKNAAVDSKLFYGQTKASMKMDFDKFCVAVASYCTASSADVKAVLDATTHTLASRLAEGYVVQLQDLGNFQMLAGSAGADTELDFSTLKVSLGGGMAVQQAVAERWKKITGTLMSPV